MTNNIKLTENEIKVLNHCRFAKYLGETEWGYSKFMVSLKDAADNIYIYYGSHCIAEATEIVTLKATITDHNIYENIKQTIIKRPKIIEVN